MVSRLPSKMCHCVSDVNVAVMNTFYRSDSCRVAMNFFNLLVSFEYQFSIFGTIICGYIILKKIFFFLEHITSAVGLIGFQGIISGVTY